jgi:hypothetical protein
MKRQPNLVATNVIAVLHFAIAIGSTFMAAAESTSPQGGGGEWLVLTYIFTFPLVWIFALFHADLGFGYAIILLMQSWCWGLLLSLLFFPKKPKW